MKFTSACGISFLMLFLLVIGSFFNAGYLNKTTSFIINELDALLADKNPSVGDVTDLRNFWEDRKRILKFTLPDSSLNAISLLFEEAIIAVQNQNIEDYKKTTARLRRAVENIYQLERLTLSNVF